MKNNKLFYILSPLFLLTLLHLYANPLYGQVAASSLFGEVKFINPAVISTRPDGQISAKVSRDMIEKSQTITSPVVADVKSEIELDTLNIFRGGKPSSAMTTELQVDYATGTLTDRVTTSSEKSEQISNATVLHATWGTSLLSFLGVSTTFVKYNYTNSFNLNLNGQDYSNDFKADINALLGRVGMRSKLGPLILGLYGDMGMVKMQTTSSDVRSNVNKSSAIMVGGGGIGLRTKMAHIEVSLEKPIELQKDENEGQRAGGEPDPSYRLSGVVEMALPLLTLGYTGTYFSGGYSDKEQIVYNQLVYPTPVSRLSHSVNFSLGASKGFTFGGSVSMSKSTTKEPIPILDPTAKQPTEVEAKGVSVKIGYVF